MHRFPPKRFLPFSIIALSLLLGCGPGEPTLDDAATAFVEARSAIENGDTATAMQKLNESIDLRPDCWAYYERAMLYVQSDNEADAKADVEAGLEIDPEHAELLWLADELKRSPGARFKGKSAEPPQISK